MRITRAARFFRQDLVAQRDALVADVDRRARNELSDGVLGLAAEGAAEMLVVGHVGPERWAVNAAVTHVLCAMAALEVCSMAGVVA